MLTRAVAIVAFTMLGVLLVLTVLLYPAWTVWVPQLIGLPTMASFPLVILVALGSLMIAAALASTHPPAEP